MDQAAEEAQLLTQIMIIESELGVDTDGGNGERRPSLEEQIQMNKERSAQRRHSLRMARLHKKRQSNPPPEVRPEPAEAEDVCMYVCMRVRA